jgi:hypothetical protein
MALKVQGIANDPLKRLAIVTFSDVLDDFPQIQATIKFATAPHHTEAEILLAIKANIRVVLEEAIERLEHFSGF